MGAKKQVTAINMISTPIVPKAHKLKAQWTVGDGPTKNDADDHCLDPANYVMGQFAFKPHEVRGWTTITVLPFLTGRLLDRVVTGYVQALRPSSVRITTGATPLDASLWRVTIYVEVCKKKMYVRSIRQEVQIGLPKGVVHGEAMGYARDYGIDSPEVKWYHDESGLVYIYGAKYKQTAKGLVRWPYKSRNKPKALWIELD